MEDIEGLVSTIAEIAANFDAAERTVHLSRGKGCPGFEVQGAYDLKAIADWRAINSKPKDGQSWLRAK
ncbi:hypothetical protein NHH03_21135 [Stieleria sp. TO1_6]|uniref:hypothetical protein n=1 Tax=Stieleria tagensis TaxID=2956795 RepID=UPI00209A71BF|nr:hypothetical protein [Stieleria tagensis]MCO8124261.1 hypothetical protein [Stieleria tagensis]